MTISSLNCPYCRKRGGGIVCQVSELPCLFFLLFFFLEWTFKYLYMLYMLVKHCECASSWLCPRLMRLQFWVIGHLCDTYTKADCNLISVTDTIKYKRQNISGKSRDDSYRYDCSECRKFHVLVLNIFTDINGNIGHA